MKVVKTTRTARQSNKDQLRLKFFLTSYSNMLQNSKSEKDLIGCINIETCNS